MSEFKIIKCKACNAPLVEKENEKLTECVQCGYKFYVVAKTVNTLNAATLSENIKNSVVPQRTSVVAKIIKWYFIIAFLIGLLVGIFNL